MIKTNGIYCDPDCIHFFPCSHYDTTKEKIKGVKPEILGNGCSIYVFDDGRSIYNLRADDILRPKKCIDENGGI